MRMEYHINDVVRSGGVTLRRSECNAVKHWNKFRPALACGLRDLQLCKPLSASQAGMPGHPDDENIPSTGWVWTGGPTARERVHVGRRSIPDVTTQWIISARRKGRRGKTHGEGFWQVKLKEWKGRWCRKRSLWGIGEWGWRWEISQKANHHKGPEFRRRKETSRTATSCCEEEERQLRDLWGKNRGGQVRGKILMLWMKKERLERDASKICQLTNKTLPKSGVVLLV